MVARFIPGLTGPFKILTLGAALFLKYFNFAMGTMF
jgi:hypothetical protein